MELTNTSQDNNMSSGKNSTTANTTTVSAFTAETGRVERRRQEAEVAAEAEAAGVAKGQKIEEDQAQTGPDRPTSRRAPLPK